MFGRLDLDNWRQFRHVEMVFHRRLTILTGANGAGKTTILHLLNRHWGWNLQYVSTPTFSKKGVRRYWTGFWGDDEFGGASDSNPPPQRQIGEIGYSSGGTARLFVPENVQEVFQVELRGAPQVFGVYVPSHRPPYIFQKVEQIPTQLDAKEQLFTTYMNELMQRFSVRARTESPSYRIKSALISLATFGYGNVAVDRNEEAVRIFEGFESVLRTMLPESLAFQSLRVRVPDVLLCTQTGNFSFDAVSGGIAAIIDLSWQIFMYSLLHDEFAVVVDEPEAHLHPALQRQLLPNLLKAFPAAQFIIATHNPFIVSAVPDSNVYVLDYGADHRVFSTLLDLVNKSGSANDILRDVLGIPATLPVWVSERLDEAVARLMSVEITEAALSDFRQSMRALGLEHVFPEMLARVLESKK